MGEVMAEARGRLPVVSEAVNTSRTAKAEPSWGLGSRPCPEGPGERSIVLY